MAFALPRLRAALAVWAVLSPPFAARAAEAEWRYCLAFTNDQSVLLISSPIASRASFSDTALRFAGMARGQGYQITDARCRQSQSEQDAKQTVKQQIELIVKLGKKAVQINWPDRRGSSRLDGKLV